MKHIPPYPEPREGEPSADYASRLGAWAWNNSSTIQARLAAAPKLAEALRLLWAEVEDADEEERKPRLSVNAIRSIEAALADAGLEE